METKISFRSNDIDEIKNKGLNVEQVTDQLNLLSKGTHFVKLQKPALSGDGLVELSNEQKYVEIFTQRNKEKMVVKFVPASGAATRMFKTLIGLLNKFNDTDCGMLEKRLGSDNKEFHFLHDFLKGLKNEKFAFTSALRGKMRKDNLKMNELLDRGMYSPIIEYLLTSKGLNYANLPKALISFHKYEDQSRTALEEHILEAGDYISTNQTTTVHFTVSTEFLHLVKDCLSQIKEKYAAEMKRIRVELSVQKKSTDTIAMDMNGQPVRNGQNQLLFRPGGHGALLENLNEIDADIVFIKNIDNVVPDRTRRDVAFYKKVLGGYLLYIQEITFAYLVDLSEKNTGSGKVEEIEQFAETKLNIIFPDNYADYTMDNRRKFLVKNLNRPFRVCGMVKNEGEPGGGPFWVKSRATGELSLQIVEAAQINQEDGKQKSIMDKSTHFNPVDIVCGIKDYNGRKFDLKKYIDWETCFVSVKTHEGKPIKALELPGLWNGAMAGWNTIFIDVPLFTFNPVKTVNDLLRPSHQSD